jgi:Ca-activated chloride channel family protein
MEFLWFYNILFLPLPFILRKLLPKLESQRAAIVVPFYYQIKAIISHNQRIGKVYGRMLFWLAWLFFVVALMRPVEIGSPIMLDKEGRNIMMAIDISGSMATEDVVYNRQYIRRIDAVKNSAEEFIKNRKGDKIGLILFGSNPYLLSPLTYDLNTVALFLENSAVGLAGRETAIGEAIALSVKILKEKEVKDKVLILLTDGANTVGLITPEDALELAKEAGVKIYTIGFGGKGRVANIFGMRVPINSNELDEETLKNIADKTGGKYFKANDMASLDLVYEEINKLEKTKDEAKSVTPVKELFYLPLLLSFILLIITMLFKND